MKKIYDINCKLRTPAGRTAMRAVLKQIKAKYPRDLLRLQKRVVCVRNRQWNDGTVGECVQENQSEDDWYDEDDNADVKLLVFIDERHIEYLVGTLAHEFGHVCTTWKDIRRRNMPKREWASEMTADWYAHKWGFGKLIEAHRKERSLGHHGPAPGSVIETGSRRYHVSRSFKVTKSTELTTEEQPELTAEEKGAAFFRSM